MKGKTLIKPALALTALLCVLLLSVFFYSRPNPRGFTLAQALNIPLPGSPWNFKGTIWGHTFDYRFPRDEENLGSLPPDIRAKLLQKVSYRDGNLVKLRAIADRFEGAFENVSLSQRPEYERTMQEIAISVHHLDVSSINPLFRHEPVLKVLPGYTFINVFSPERAVKAVRERLDVLGFGNRSRVFSVPVLTRVKSGIEMPAVVSRWAQDLFEVSVGPNGAEYVFSPVALLQTHDLTMPDNYYLEALGSEGRMVATVPLFFQGGNIMVGEVHEKKIVFVGENELKGNASHYYSTVFSYPPQDRVKEVFRQITGADWVTVLPNCEYLFHIDFVVTFLEKGVAAVISPLDRGSLKPCDLRAIDDTRYILSAMGFKIVDIPTVAERIRSFQSSVNIVPFTHRDTGERYAIVPRYPDLQVVLDGVSVSLDKAIKLRYEGAGVKVLDVEDRFYEKHGNTHCAVNVIK